MNYPNNAQGLVSINVGSSSVKFSVYPLEAADSKPTLLNRGKVDGIGSNPVLTITDHHHQPVSTQSLKTEADLKTIITTLLEWISKTYPTMTVKGVGHRVVHGGTFYSSSVLVTESVLKNLETLSSLMPQHQPYCLQGIEVCQDLLPSVPQVACFDTSFHATLPLLETLFGLPFSLWDQGIRRYGFHGLSYQHVANLLPAVMGDKANGKVIVAHLGHGASLCALKDQESVATTMGFSALDGLPMGTRCGSLDPGVLLYLLTQKHLTVPQIEDLLYNKSGLLGLSGISDDMRNLISSKDNRAKISIDYFCYRIQKELASLIAVLEGIDALIFTGGIGENIPLIRAKVCDAFRWMNAEIDPDLNASSQQGTPRLISTNSSQVAVWVIPANEESVIVQETAKLVC